MTSVSYVSILWNFEGALGTLNNLMPQALKPGVLKYAWRKLFTQNVGTSGKLPFTFQKNV